jgi:serine/threonine-protein kinase RsbT
MSKLVTADSARVEISNEADIVKARQFGRALARQLGFSSSAATLVATAISELARNILLYAGRGELTMRPVNSGERAGLVVTASDEGPGMPDVNRALQDGFSTSGRLGLGLPGVRRLMDDFNIDATPGKGTTVTVRKWRE